MKIDKSSPYASQIASSILNDPENKAEATLIVYEANKEVLGSKYQGSIAPAAAYAAIDITKATADAIARAARLRAQYENTIETPSEKNIQELKDVESE